jgi:DNA-binding LytR/AlgR family response regulator
MHLRLPPVSTTAQHRSSERRGTLVHCYVADADPFDRQLLSDAINRVDGAVLIGATSDASAMTRAVRDSCPDVLFLDARTGADLLRAGLMSDATQCCVVFVSPVAADAASAFTYDATDFVLKPYSRERIAVAVERVRRRMNDRALIARASSGEPMPGEPSHVRRQAPPDDMLAIASARGTDYLTASAIHSLVAAGSASRIVTSHGVIETPTSLFTMERQLDPAHFVRTHRCALVNVRSVRRLEAVGTGGRLLLHTGDTLPVSKRRMAAVRRALMPARAEREA